MFWRFNRNVDNPRLPQFNKTVATTHMLWEHSLNKIYLLLLSFDTKNLIYTVKCVTIYTHTCYYPTHSTPIICQHKIWKYVLGITFSIPSHPPSLNVFMVLNQGIWKNRIKCFVATKHHTQNREATKKKTHTKKNMLDIILTVMFFGYKICVYVFIYSKSRNVGGYGIRCWGIVNLWTGFIL